MKSVKILAIAAGGILALIVAALLVVWLTVNPNDYKGRIANGVKESTGRDLVLKGDLKLAVFPWIALEMGPASLGNPPGFGEEPFLAFNHAAVRVRLLPLLAKHLEVDRVDLDGLDLRLRQNAQGVGNWQDFGSKDKAAPAKDGRSGMPQIELAGLRITNGRVSYQKIVIDKFDLETGAFGGSGATPVRMGLQASRGVPGESVTFNAKFSVIADAKMEDLHLGGVNFSGEVSRPGDSRPAHWEISASAIEANLSQQTLAVPEFAASFGGAHLTGKLSATKIIDDLSATGSVALAPVVLHEFAPRFGIALPRTSDPRALAQFAASSDFSYGPGGVKFEKLLVQLDDTHLKGDAAFAGEPRAFKFDLTLDEINLDRYLSPDKSAAPAQAKPAEKPAKFPEAAGTLSVGVLHFSPLDFSNVRVTVASKDNVVHLFPAQAQIDGGSYSGNITLDNRGATPALSLDEHLAGVDMARLLAATSYKGRMSGRGNVNVKATARGAALPAVLQTLNGHFDANLSNGALEGTDLGYELKAAQALIKKEAPPAKSGPARTAFDACKLSAEITNGIAKTSDLTISSAVLRVGGQGSANLASKAIDFNLLASVLKAPGATMADIPLKITGTYMDPTIRPDVEALAKGQLKDKLKDVLKKNGLEGLFGK